MPHARPSRFVGSHMNGVPHPGTRFASLAIGRPSYVCCLRDTVEHPQLRDLPLELPLELGDLSVELTQLAHDRFVHAIAIFRWYRKVDHVTRPHVVVLPFRHTYLAPAR